LTIDFIEKMHDGKLRGIFHCFTGTLDQAKRIVEMGFLLGIGGVATYKNGGLDQVIPYIGLEHLVLETDAPYLAPVPHRGKRNSPAFLPFIAERVGDLLQIPATQVAEATSVQALQLFTKIN
jgi:TatD DNase family protein